MTSALTRNQISKREFLKLSTLGLGGLLSLKFFNPTPVKAEANYDPWTHTISVEGRYHPSLEGLVQNIHFTQASIGLGILDMLLGWASWSYGDLSGRELRHGRFRYEIRDRQLVDTILEDQELQLKAQMPAATYTVNLPIVTAGYSQDDLHVSSHNIETFLNRYKGFDFHRIMPGDRIAITFDKALDARSVNDSTVVLYDSSSSAPVPIPVRLSVDGQVLYISPKDILPEEKFCQVYLGGIKASSGRGLASPYKQDFLTADVTPPSIPGALMARGDSDRPGTFYLDFTATDNLNQMPSGMVYFTTNLEKAIDQSTIGDADVFALEFSPVQKDSNTHVNVDLVGAGLDLESIVTDPSGRQKIKVATTLQDIAGNVSAFFSADSQVEISDNYIRAIGDNLSDFMLEYKGGVFYRVDGPIRIDFDRPVNSDLISEVKLIDVTDNNAILDVAIDVRESSIFIYPTLMPQEHVIKLSVDGVQSRYGAMQRAPYWKEFTSADSRSPYLLGAPAASSSDTQAGMFVIRFTPKDDTNHVEKVHVYATPDLGKTIDDSTIADSDVYHFEFEGPFANVVEVYRNVDFIAAGYSIDDLITDPSGILPLKVAVRVDDVAGNKSEYLTPVGDTSIVDHARAYVSTWIPKDVSHISTFYDEIVALIQGDEMLGIPRRPTNDGSIYLADYARLTGYFGGASFEDTELLLRDLTDGYSSPPGYPEIVMDPMQEGNNLAKYANTNRFYLHPDGDAALDFDGIPQENISPLQQIYEDALVRIVRAQWSFYSGLNDPGWVTGTRY